MTEPSRVGTVRMPGMVLLTALLIAACADDTALRAAQSRADSLASLLAATKAELDSLTTQPDRLLADARQALAEDRTDQAIAIAKQLVATHPQASEAGAAREIVQQGEARVAAAAEAVRRAHDDSLKATAVRTARALAGMRKQHDDVKGIMWYTDRSVPVAVSGDRRLFLYIGQEDGGGAPFLRFAIRYSADDWLFIERYLIKTESGTTTLTPEDYGPEAVERDNGYGGIWEWWDVRATPEHLRLINEILASKRATLRYEGKQYYHDRTITESERAALRRTLAAFAALGGTAPAS